MLILSNKYKNLIMKKCILNYLIDLTFIFTRVCYFRHGWGIDVPKKLLASYEFTEK